MARYSKDRLARSISIGPAIQATSPKENAATTPKNSGVGQGAGDEFVYVPLPSGGGQYPANLSWDVSVVGGGGALVVNLEGSSDGFVTVAVVDTINNPAGGAKSVANPGFAMYRGNITTWINGTVTVGISM